MTRKKALPILGLFFLVSFYFLLGGEISSVDPNHGLKNYSLYEISFIKSLVDKISEKELRDYVLALQDLGTRYAPSQGNLKAAGYIKDAFLSYGLKEVTLDEFSYYNDQTDMYDRSRNVVASKPGVKAPDKIVIIGAHFDTISRSAEDGGVSAVNKENPAPGADDNGTGVATVLAAARLLGPYEFDWTLRFIAFSAEEAGIFGSAHYAAESARKGEDIVAVINVDQIGHVKEEPEDIDIFANRKSAWLLDRITNRAPIYAPDLLVYRIVNDTYDGSDHAPFWNNGYPAICFMEDYYPSYRHYHTPKDTVDGINFSFVLKSTRLAVANLAELAGLRISEAPAAPLESFRKDFGFKGVNWQQDSGKKFLITISPSPNQANVIDISLPRISSNTSLSLGDIPAETWGQPRYYPVAAYPKPAGKLIYVSMTRFRAPGKETKGGIVEIIDPAKGQIVGSFDAHRNPSSGCFNAAGTKFYQPYWGEKFIDIFDTTSLKSTARIETPLSLSKLAVLEGEKRAIGLSSEANAVIIIDLVRKSVEKVLNDIATPKDVVAYNNRFAWVCSYEQAKIYQVDVIGKSILGEIETSPRPVRLALSPRKDLIISLHQLSKQIDLFKIIQSNGKLTLEKNRTLDLGELVVDGTFAGNNSCYFVSPGKYRVFGLDLLSGKTFWAMRTGGVRGRDDVEKIIYIGE